MTVIAAPPPGVDEDEYLQEQLDIAEAVAKKKPKVEKPQKKKS